MRARGTLVAAFAFPLLVAAVTALVVNVPMYDEWTWAPFVLAMHDGTLQLRDLWSPQGAHRMVVPTVLALGLARLDGWNIRVEAFVSLGCAVLTQLVLYRVFTRAFGARGVWPFLLASALVFSLAQAENWVWGFQFSWFLVNLCAVVAVERLGAPRLRARDVAIAAFGAVVASYSLIFGFGVWCAGAVMLARRPRALAMWAILAALCALVFLVGYHVPSAERGWAVDPLAALGFFLAYLGGPVAGYLGRVPALLAGLAFTVATVLCLRSIGKNPAAPSDCPPWLALIGFSLCAALFETIGRAGNGVDAALASRYTTASTLAWVGLVGLVASAPLALPLRRGLAGALAAMLVITGVAGYVYAYVLVGLQRSALVAVHNPRDADDDELAEYANDPAFLRAQAARLREAHLGPFAR